MGFFGGAGGGLLAGERRIGARSDPYGGHRQLEPGGTLLLKFYVTSSWSKRSFNVQSAGSHARLLPNSASKSAKLTVPEMHMAHRRATHMKMTTQLALFLDQPPAEPEEGAGVTVAVTDRQ